MGTTDHALDAVGASDSFRTSRRPLLAVDSDWVIRAVNQCYLELTGRAREDLLGRFMFDAFPDNPADETADGTRNLAASFARVMRTAQPSYMLVQRYDVRRSAQSDEFVLKYWSPVNEPVRDDLSGRPVGVLHTAEDVTRLWAPLLAESAPDTLGLGPALARDPDCVSLLSLALRRNELARRQLTLELSQLQGALDSRIVIEQAKGVLVEREQVPPSEAFEILRQESRSSRRRMQDVAHDLVRAAQGQPVAEDPSADR